MDLGDTYDSQQCIEQNSPSYVQNDSQNNSYNADNKNLPTIDANHSQKEYSNNAIDLDSKNIKEYSSREILDAQLDKDLYDEILDKLDIKSRLNNHPPKKDSLQNKLSQDNTISNDDSQVNLKIGKALSNDFTQIQNLIKGGLINSQQGQNLKKQVLKKAFDMLVQSEKIKQTQSPAKMINQIQKSYNNQVNQGNEIDDISSSNPNFFSGQGRKEVLNYLKSGNVNLGNDELNKISNIVRIVEKAAIDGYLQKATHEKTLRNSNKNAKQRLTANAQKSAYGENLSRTFTREQIGKMSGAEFAKYESGIMEQLKKGLIR